MPTINETQIKDIIITCNNCNTENTCYDSMFDLDNNYLYCRCSHCNRIIDTDIKISYVDLLERNE